MMRGLAFLLVATAMVAAMGCGASADDEDTAPHASARGADARAKPIQASVNRDVFHRPDCQWAKRISERNLAGYDTVQDAQADGRRACQVCKP